MLPDAPRDIEQHLPLIASTIDPSVLRSIGYLSRGIDYEMGDVPELVFERLCDLTQDAWAPWATTGVHFCDLCRFTGNSIARYQRVVGSKQIRSPGYVVSAVSSSSDVWIPGDGMLWICPTSITHYIDAHSFGLPPAFCEAVLKCPPMRSVEYFKALLNNGGRQLGFGAALTAKKEDITDRQ
jgi:hypothetical protein